MDYPLKTLGQLRPILVGFRKKAGLTQTAVAQRLGISQQSYAAFEANPETASVERLFRVLRLVDVEIRLGAADEEASPVAAKPARRPPSPPAAARMSSTAKPAPARKRARTPPAASEPARRPAARRKPREDW